MNFQDVILTLQDFWAKQGCAVVQPMDIECGAGTFNPSTFLRVIGPEPWAAAYVEPSRRPTDGRYGDNVMKLMVSQNAPFVPMFDAWRADSRAMLPYPADKARRDVAIIDAKVLSNRRPPYEIKGGLYDALKATDGEILVATNAQARKAAKLFQQLEGVDIHPAAAVATATLIKAVQDGKIDSEATVMLNITGAGEERAKKNKELWHLKPSKVFSVMPDFDEVITYVENLF